MKIFLCRLLWYHCSVLKHEKRLYVCVIAVTPRWQYACTDSSNFLLGRKHSSPWSTCCFVCINCVLTSDSQDLCKGATVPASCIREQVVPTAAPSPGSTCITRSMLCHMQAGGWADVGLQFSTGLISPTPPMLLGPEGGAMNAHGSIHQQASHWMRSYNRRYHTCRLRY